MENDLIRGINDNKPAYYYTELKLIIQLETVIQPEDYTAKTHMHSKYKQANSSEKENRGRKKDGRCYTRIFGQVFMENIESIDLLLRTSAWFALAQKPHNITEGLCVVTGSQWYNNGLMKLSLDDYQV